MISIRRIGQGFFNNMYNHNGSFSIYISKYKQQCMVGELRIQAVKKKAKIKCRYLFGWRSDHVVTMLAPRTGFIATSCSRCHCMTSWTWYASPREIRVEASCPCRVHHWYPPFEINRHQKSKRGRGRGANESRNHRYPGSELRHWHWSDQWSEIPTTRPCPPALGRSSVDARITSHWRTLIQLRTRKPLTNPHTCPIRLPATTHSTRSQQRRSGRPRWIQYWRLATHLHSSSLWNRHR